MTISHQAIDAARQFFSGSAKVELEKLGRGLINDTYRVTDSRERWVLQRINRNVFHDPRAVMANIRKVTDHVGQPQFECSGSQWRLPQVIPTRAGEDVHQDDEGEYWRAITYIENTRSLESISCQEQADEVGRALGWFHSLVNDLPADDLHDTLPGFHETPRYLASFDSVCECYDPLCDTPEITEAFDFIDTHRRYADVLEAERANGRLSSRVIHGDPKLDNVLFDIDSGLAVSLIDLDTVKPGLLHYDLGDCFRSCCNLAGESAGARKPVFDLEIFRRILQGYLREAGHILTHDDRELLYESIRLLPFELGLRFLTDHLSGDSYFKVERSGQNLSRALSQFHLATSIEAQELQIRQILRDLTKPVG